MVSANSPGSSARHPLRIEVAGQTDVGRKRAHNEDNFAIMPEFGLYVVADGMGGHASGEIASKMAIETLQEFFESTAEDPERTWPYRMDRGRGYEENRLITGNDLHTVARGLLEYETLSGQEIKDLINGKPPVRDFPAEDTDDSGPQSSVPVAGPKKPPAADAGGMAPQPT